MSIEDQLKQIPVNIKRMRKIRDLSQFQLAELADLSQSYLANLEQGKYTPSVETILKLASALNINPGDLLPETKTKPDQQSKKARIIKLIDEL